MKNSTADDDGIFLSTSNNTEDKNVHKSNDSNDDFNAFKNSERKNIDQTRIGDLYQETIPTIYCSTNKCYIMVISKPVNNKVFVARIFLRSVFDINKEDGDIFIGIIPEISNCRYAYINASKICLCKISTLKIEKYDSSVKKIGCVNTFETKRVMAKLSRILIGENSKKEIRALC